MTSETNLQVSTSKHTSELTVDESQTESPTQPDSQEAKLLIGILFALFLSVIGATVIGLSWQYGLGTEENLIGPGTAPVVLGALITLGGLWIAAKDTWALKKLRSSDTENQTSSSRTRLSRQYLVRTIGLPVGIVLLYSAGIFLTQFTGIFLTLLNRPGFCSVLI